MTGVYFMGSDIIEQLNNNKESKAWHCYIKIILGDIEIITKSSIYIGLIEDL